MGIISKIKDLFKKKITFNDIKDNDYIYLYAGDIPNKEEYNREGIVGLSITHADYRTIRHDITRSFLLDDNTVDIFQAEDVFEHIEYEKLVQVLNEIYRVLKPGGIFRLSVPDYKCDILYERTMKDNNGKLIFDKEGGGDFIDGKVVDGGHVWFPTYEMVKGLIDKSMFNIYKFYHYYDENGKSITENIDYSIGYIQRTPDHDERVRNPYRGMSIVCDCVKESKDK